MFIKKTKTQFKYLNIHVEMFIEYFFQLIISDRVKEMTQI